MAYYSNVLEVIGHTPLIQLSKVTEGAPVTLLAKAEFLNPGGSVKDRVGLRMIEDAERRGVLRPGGTIIEATAGNTGAGLALVAAVKGYRCIFVLPDKMSEDKVNLLKAYGAEVVITPTSVPPDSPESYNGVADRLAREIPGAYRPNQFANPQNPAAHHDTTGPEIWEGTDGKVDVFVAGMGTGGTISGTGQFLKERNPKVTVVGVDPAGSILSGDAPKSYKIEGVGEDFIPATFNRQADRRDGARHGCGGVCHDAASGSRGRAAGGRVSRAWLWQAPSSSRAASSRENWLSCCCRTRDETILERFSPMFGWNKTIFPLKHPKVSRPEMC